VGDPEPPPPSGATWRGNEPAGLTERVDTDFDFAIPSGSSDMVIGIDGIAGITGNNTGNATRVTDQDGPYSAPDAYQLRYPAGLSNGGSAGTMYGTLPAGTTETYCCFWMKYDPDYEFNTVSEKTFIWDVDVILQTRWGDHWLNLVWGANELPPNQSIEPDLSDGEWHLIEFYCDTTSGTLRVWWNGDLTSEYTGVTSGIPATRGEWSLLGIWGGSGAARATTGYRWIDHLYVSSAT
jgi:hypothetical protein